MQKSTLVIIALALAVLMESIAIWQQQRIIRDARIYVTAGCHGHYEGQGNLDANDIQ